jgi:hypothetical protein
MTSELSSFAAQLRDQIARESRCLAGLQAASEGSKHGCPSFRAAAAQASLRDEVAFNRLALGLFALQFAGNPPYRRFVEGRRLPPEAVRHWRQIPAVPAAAFKEWELSALPPAQRVRVFHSSGTTDQRPSRHVHSRESLAVYEDSLIAWFRAAALPDLDFSRSEVDWLILTPAADQAPHSSLVHMFEVIRSAAKAPATAFVGKMAEDGAWALDLAAATDTLSRAGSTRRPLLLLGTAFSLVHLLDHLAERRLRFVLPAGSRVMETGGYKGRSRFVPKKELHALIRQRLGVPEWRILCEYGMCELSSQAYDATPGSTGRGPRRGERRFRFPPWARCQVISPETGAEVADGETGLLRVFDLANVFSVMALQTEDLVVRSEDGFQWVGRAQGAESRGCSLTAQTPVSTTNFALR